MSYYFREEHEIFRQSLRKYTEKTIQPHIEAWEEAGEVPREVFRDFGKQGYFGVQFPEEYGGVGGDFFYDVILLEEMQRTTSGGLAAALGAHAYLALPHLYHAGSDYLKAEYLTPGIAGEKIGCLAVTEPFGGSNVADLRTTADKNGDVYVLNGSKTFITNGVNSDFLVVAARTGGKGASGISMFVVDRDLPGVSATKLNKLGWKASDTGEIGFADVPVPAKNLLGQENQGFLYIMQRFALERLIIAVGAVAAADYALEITLRYMNDRTAFGRPLNKFQELRHRVAQMATEIECQRQFTYQLCQFYQDGGYPVKEAAMAKLITTQLCDRVISDCLQMHGGYGFMEEFPLARMFRDSRLGPIGGGTSEIMCEIIAKSVIDQKTY